MKTLQLIKIAHVTAIKENNKVAKALFSTLRGEIENELKSKTAKSENDIIESYAKKYTENAKLINTDESNQEIELLKPFMAEVLGDSEYDKIAKIIVENNADKVEQYVNGNKNMFNVLIGAFMKEAKQIYAGVSIDAVKARESLTSLLTTA
jgi:Asp-tRNA(Asn)/Glu-tRNA(Gln) amidotransferase B subunit